MSPKESTFSAHSMTVTQMASFSLWALTAFAATGILLSFEAHPKHPVRHFAEIPNVAFSADEMAHVFASQTLAQAQPIAVAATHLKVQAIIYSSNPAMSYAVIADNDQIKHYPVGSTLPNGARLTAIDKRRIHYELQGSPLHIDLPEN